MLALAVAVAIALAELAARLTRMALTATSGGDLRDALWNPVVRRPIPITRVVVFAAVVTVMTLAALEIAGVALPVAINRKALAVWIFGSGLRVLIIALLTYLLLRVITATTARLETQISDRGGADLIERSKRARTLSGLIRNVLTALVTSIAALMILSEFDVDIMPVLTGAGIVGLAVGFGAQTLVKDLISGFFLIFENIVEAVNLRTVVSRDLEGIVRLP